jgi:hypothetical protein
MAGSLEKTVWTFKQIYEEDMINENYEIILNFFDKSKYELNMNKYIAKLYFL